MRSAGVIGARAWPTHARVQHDRDPAQYAFSRARDGQNSRDFFTRLLANRYATAYVAARTARAFTPVQYRPLYAAIGDPSSRHRKPTPLP